MERSKKPKKKKWRKEGRGSFRLGKRIIKPGQVFSAYESEIPKGAMDIIVPLDPSDSVDTKKPDAATYELVDVGGGWFDVKNEAGKVLNEKRMRREEALELIKKLETD